MLFPDGLYAERPDGSLRFSWAKAPTSVELAGKQVGRGKRAGEAVFGKRSEP